jgi:peptidylprolyl isomerase
MTLAEKLGEAKRHKTAGTGRFKARDFTGAIAKYEQALQTLLTESDSNMRSGELRDPEGAKDEMQCSCALNAAVCALKLQRWASCVSYCSSALELQPANIKGLYRRGCAHTHLGEYAEAKQDLLAAKALAEVIVDGVTVSQTATSKEILKALHILKQKRRDEKQRAQVYVWYAGIVRPGMVCRYGMQLWAMRP